MGGVGLSEDRPDRGGDHLRAGLGHPGQDVSHEMDPAALPARPDEHRGDGGLEPEMMIGDDQGDPGEASGPQGAQERRPKRSVFAVADLDAENLTVAGGGHPGGHHDRPGDDPAAHPGLHVGGIGEHVREPDMVETASAERLEISVELGADPRHLRLGDTRPRRRAL